MTALKPIEDRDVHAATLSSTTYPSNTICAVPGCQEKVDLRPDGTPTVHHAFPKSQIHSDSYYVQIGDDETLDYEVIPHAIGLCGSGTTGHHGDVEEHRAWIRLEDGVWNWYKLIDSKLYTDEPGKWDLIGPLEPQPGQLAAVEKKKRRVFRGEQKRNRTNWQIKVPKDNLEDGAGILDDGFADAYDVVATLSDLDPMSDRTPYVCLADLFEYVRQLDGLTALRTSLASGAERIEVLEELADIMLPGWRSTGDES